MMLSEASEVLQTLALSLSAATLRIWGVLQRVWRGGSQRGWNYVVVFNHMSV